MSGYNAVLARNTQNAPKAIGPYSQTVAFSHYNNLSAQLPVDPASGKLVAGGVKEQAEQCFKNIKAVVESINHVMDDVVRITIFVKNIADLDAVSAVYKTFFTTGYVPALTTVAVAALPMNALVQVEALLSNGEGTIPNAPQAGDLIKIARNTAAAPQSPLSTQTVAFSHYNNISAQLPIDPKTGIIVSGGVKEQATQCLKNIKAILTSIDVPFDDIVKINIFLTDLAHFGKVNEAMAAYFQQPYPARAAIGVAALPRGGLVEADAVSRQLYDDAVSQRNQAAADVAQARATQARKQLDLGFATIRAPISGRIGEEMVTEGALVGTTDTAPMARIQQIDQVYVDVRQPASRLEVLRRSAGRPHGPDGQATILDAQGNPYPVKGQILFSGINVDAGTGDVVLRIRPSAMAGVD